jgi:two-component system OmpR family response regulator
MGIWKIDTPIAHLNILECSRGIDTASHGGKRLTGIVGTDHLAFGAGELTKRRGSAMVEGPILIVDDDPVFPDAISTALMLAGFRTEIAHDGLEALEFIQRERPSLILLDVSMPVLDGRGLLRELAREGIKLPVVLVSAGQDGERIARKYGVAAYLQKPVALPRLLAAISACRSGGVFPADDRRAAS